MHDLITIGWRERLSLPDLGLALKAKIDTGARTSALHVAWLQEFTRDGRTWLQFAVDTTRGKSAVARVRSAGDGSSRRHRFGRTHHRALVHPQHDQHRAPAASTRK